MRFLALVSVTMITGCAPAPAPDRNPTAEAWYGQTVEQLAALNREAESSFENHQPDRAAALIEKGEPLVKRLLSVSRPTLPAVEAASDLDHLSGRMLLSNRHYGYARLLFQKNLSRWKHWQPATPHTARRLKQAKSAIAECDRHMAE